MNKHLLRTVVLSCVLCLMFVVSKAQWVSIPDSNFGTWLDTNGYTSCMQGSNALGWQMDTTCSAIVNAANVNCGYRGIRDLTGIQYFDNLKVLICSYNHLDSVPLLPYTLQTLNCSANQLSILPALSNSLTVLDCSVNLLNSLTDLPDSLTSLTCYNNQLNSLPALPNLLFYLQCSVNLFDSLPTLPNSLTYLDCTGNQLSSLPTLPNSLTFLGCNGNQLSSLPSLPDSLTLLSCYNNQLSSLPILPNLLMNLNCEDNQLSSLPILPNSLTQLRCGGNQLSGLPELPDSLFFFECTNNLNLLCLPQLKKISEFYFYSTSITCLPNYPESNSLSNPSLNTVPLCSFFNPNGCAFNVIIESARESAQFSISPNPATNSVTITVDETMLNSTLTVYDITGKKMTAVQLRTSDTRLPTSDFSNGIYFVTIENENGRTTKKLVIEK